MMKILIDTDAFVALAKENDLNHQKAIKIAHKIKNDTQFISPFTLPEAATVLSHKVSQEAAVKFLAKARKEEFEEIILTKELEAQADEIFIQQKKNHTSWPDCLNMAILNKFHLDSIFSFDKVYSQNSFQIVKI